MTDWTAGARVKVERAIENIRQLEAEVVAFFEPGDPYVIVADHDTKPGRRDFRVKVNTPIPAIRWGVIVGEIVHGFRSALDVLYFQMISTAAAPKRIDAKLAFRIFDTQVGFEAARFPEIERWCQAAMDVYKATKPYRTGNLPLWHISELDNADKHRVITTVAAVHIVTSWNIDLDGFRLPVGIAVGGDVQPIEDGAIIGGYAATASDPMDVHPELTVFVAFGQGEVVEREPVLPALYAFKDVVSSIIEDFSRIPFDMSKISSFPTN